MCGFNFVVFLSAFQLLPTAPFRILDVGGGTVAAGLFLGFLTYASAFSAPFTGAIADRIGRRRTLVICSTAIFLMSFAYAMTTTWPPMLAIVFVHGLFWSGLLTAAGAYVTDLMPASRRAEGIGYYGISTILAVAVAPARRPLGLPARLALALRLDRHVESDDGAYCDAVGGISTQYRRGREAAGCRTKCWSGA